MKHTWRRWLQKLMSTPRKRKRQGPAYHPRIEQLEDRLVLTQLSIPTNLAASRGGTVQVPINVDVLSDLNPDPNINQQSGLSGGTFVVWYNPSVLFLNPSTDVALGTIGNPSISGDGYSPANPNGWQISSPQLNNTGELVFGVVNSNSIFISGTGGGSLAVINFHVLANAPLGPSMIDLAQDISGPGSQPMTFISDDLDDTEAAFNYVLKPNPNSQGTNGPIDNTGGVELLSFGGMVTGGTFKLTFGSGTTGPITYSSNASVLQSNIQAAIDNPNVVGAGNSIVNATSATSVSVTFEGIDGGGQGVGPLAAISSLSGTSPTITIATRGSLGQPLYAYYGTDPTDGAVTVTGVNQPPVATNDSYSITERDVATDPGLSVAAPGVLANDTDPQGASLTASLLSAPTHGTLTFNSDGSFVYTPNTGYLGADSFTYQDTDSQTSLTSNIATVNLTATARLSIPTTIAATPGQTITVPVNIDNPNPQNSGGLAGAALAINFDSNVLQFATALAGTVTSATNEVQTISFGGIITGGTFTLTFTNAANTVATTGPIIYSFTPSVLQTNIQSALNNLSNIGTTGTSPNALVSFNSATTGTVTFQNTLGDTFFKTLTVSNNLGGFNPTAAVATTITGQTNWNLAVTPNNGTEPGKLGIAFNSVNGKPQLSTVGGSLVLLVFNVNANAAGGPTDIFIVPNTTPGVLQVTTSIGFGGSLILPPRPQLQPDPNFVAGVDGVVTVSGGSHFAITSPASAAAGVGLTFTVVAEDSSNNVFTGYTGTVHFSSSDSQAALPLDTKLTNGVGIFVVVWRAAGNQTVLATDSATTSIAGSSGPITVSAAAATHFAVGAPAAATSGQLITFTVTAEDQFNNVANGYTGTVHFTSNDPKAFLANDATLTGGAGSFGAFLETAGTATITATDTTTTSITGSSQPIFVSPGLITHFGLAAPAFNPGVQFLVTVTAEDAFNNTVPAYTGTVNLSSSDTAALFNPQHGQLQSGQSTFGITLFTVGSQTITATDSATPSIFGTATLLPSEVQVHFLVSAPSSVTAGGGFLFTVAAEDRFNNAVTSFNGTVGLTSSDSLAVATTSFPSSGTLISGTGTFAAVLKTAGSQTLTATSATSGIVGTSGPITVSAAAATHFGVSAPATASAGSSLPFTVTAFDQFNNVASGYAGAIHFTSSDNQATLPANANLNAGIGTFSATLKTAGSQIITATDAATSSISSSSNSITVTASSQPATHLVISGVPANTTAGTPFSFTVTADDQFNNTATGYGGTVHFTSSDSQAPLPQASPLAGGVGTFTATLLTAGNQTLTAFDTANNLIVNGNFESGNVGFTSSYPYSPGNLLPDPVYDVVSDPHLDHRDAVSYHDHTSGSGLMFAANAAETPNVVVWAETVPVNPGALYSFSVWDSSWTSGSPAVLDFLFDGVSIGTSTAPLAAGVWQQFTSTWNSGTNSSLTLQIIDRNTAFSFNDFAIDDISLQGPNPVIASGTASTTVHAALAQATHLAISVPASVGAGSAFVMTVMAEDQSNNIATGYTGIIHFTSSDNQAVLPTNGTLINGVGTFSVTLKTAGSQTITATDAATSSISGFSNPITVTGTVSGKPATHFALLGLPNPIPIGTAVAFTVEALDSNNNIDTGYNGTTHFTSSDSKAVLPASAPLTAGVGTFSATLETLGGQSITVTGPPYDSAPSFVNAPGSPISVISAYSFKVGGYLSGGNTFDLMETSGYYGTFAILVGNGNGTFSQLPAQTTGEGGGVGPNSAAIGDFRGNGINDLAFVDNYPFITVVLGNGDGTFGPPATYNVGNNPKSVVAGSFNGSAQDDLAVLNSSDGTITILMANPQGSYGTTFLVPTTILTVGTLGSVASPQAGSNNPLLTVGHFTNDGNLDLAVVNGGANAVEVFLGNGNGTFRPGLTFAAGTTPYSIAAADLSNNGIQDLVVNNPSGGAISVLMGNGNGTFQRPASYAAGPNPGVPVIADMNGDGKPDIVLNESDTNEVGILLGNGDGTFHPAPFLASSNNGNTPVIVGDLTGQGLPDIMVGAINVYLNQPLISTTPVVVGQATATHFTVTAPSTAVAGTPTTVTVTAFDASNNTATGYTGLVHFTSSDNQAVLPTNAALINGVGTFSVTLKTAGSQTITATDAVTSSISGVSNAITVTASSQPATHFVIAGYPNPAPIGTAFHFTVEALDGQNNLASGYNGTVHFSSSDSNASLPAITTLTNGVGNFTATLKTAGSQTLTVTSGGSGAAFVQAPGSPITVSADAVTLAVGDFNGDGKLDVAVASDYGGTLNILLGNGNGTFQSGPTYNIGFNDQGLVTGDFNGDGKLDLALTVYDSGIIEVMIGNGNGTFAPPVSYAVGTNPCALAVVDFNHDGKLDLAVANIGSNNVSVLLGNGDGTFKPAVNYAVGSEPTRIAVGDLNGDGFQDIVVGDQGTSTVSVLLGNGNGTFLPAANFVSGPAPFGVAIGEFNGDGKPDLAVTNYQGASVSVLLGNGNGTYGPPTTYAAGAGADFVVTADLNADGRTDLVVTNRESNTANVLLGNGNGTFAYGQTLAVAALQRQVAVADVNGDGAPDVIAVGSANGGSLVGHMAIFLNQAISTSVTISVSPAAASHFAISAPTQTAPSAAFVVTVTALDAFNNTATGYTGAVHFTSSDNQAVLPANATLLNGVGIFSVTLKTSGSQTLIATDTVTASVTGVSAPINVTGPASPHFSISGPSAVSAGSLFVFTVTALDQSNNINTGYTGIVHLTSSDSQALLPANAQLTNGVGFFGAALRTVGRDTLIATDTATSAITGSITITVSAANATHFGVGAPATTPPNNPIVFTVTAFDPFNNTATNYAGTVNFTSSDGQAFFSAGSPLTSGVGHFAAVFLTIGTQTITATDSATASITGTSNPIIVGTTTPAATHFALGTPGVTTVGSAFNLTVTAEDQSNNTAASYTGVVHFTTSDGAGVVPTNYTFVPGDHGVHVFASGVTLNTAGNQTVIATDTVTASLTGTSSPIAVSATAPTHLVISGVPANSTAGTAFRFTVTAEDQFNNVAPGYTGIVHFSSSDSQAVIPLASSLTGGVGTFSATLRTAGSQSVTASDATSNLIVNGDFEAGNVGFTSNYVFNQRVNGSYVLTTDPSLITNQAVSYHDHTSGSGLMFMADGALTSNVVVWSETVPVTPNSLYGFSIWISTWSGNTPAVLNFLFNGVSIGNFTVSTTAALWQQFTANWNSGANSAVTLQIIDLNTVFSYNDFSLDDIALQGPNPLAANSASATTLVSPAAASHFAVNAPVTATTGAGFTLTVTADDPFNNAATGYTGSIHFASTDTGAILPANGTLANGIGTFSATLKTAGNQTLMATDANSPSITGSAAVLVKSATPADTIFPFVQSINRGNPASPTTNASSVSFTVTFSEPVTGVDATDFQLAQTGTVAATLGQVTPVSGAVYTVTVSGITGNGTLGLNLVDNGSIHDLAGNPLVQGSGAASFQSQTTLASGAQPVYVTVTDVNGDGKPDMVVANVNSNTVGVLLGNGNGTFQGLTTFATGAHPYSVIAADVNGDGKPDLLVANFNSNTVGVLLGNGNGTFQAQTAFATGLEPILVSVGDFNGDGKLDLAVTNNLASSVSVLLGNGNGTFQGQVAYAAGTFPIPVVVADVNGDGKSDLMIANRGSNTVSVLLGNGNGTFQSQIAVPAGSATWWVSVMDVNGDGKLDLVVANKGDNDVGVLLGNGNGTFQGQMTFASGGTPICVATADMNGDGKADILVANFADNTIGVLLGNGNGTFQSQSTLATGSSPGSFTVADINGDGRLDVIVANKTSNTFSLLLNAGNGNFTGQTYTITAPDTIFPFVQSINRANPVGPTTNASTVSFTVTFSEPVTGVDASDFQLALSGTTATVSQVTPVSGAVYTVTVSGITGNGTLGLNLVDNGSIHDLAGNPLVQANGPAAFQNQKTFALGSEPSIVAVADVNGDGIPDLMVTNGQGSSVSVLLGNGNGTFQSQVTYVTGPQPYSIAVGDINGDGKPDLAIISAVNNNVGLLLGNGNGTFQNQTLLATGARPLGVALFDVNGDGKLDLIVSNASSNTVGVMLGNGNGTFQSQNSFQTLYPASVARVADLNGDGIPDLVVGNRHNSTVSLLLGNGNGTFQSSNPLAVGASPQSVAVADVNGDGKLDLVVVNYTSNNVSVLLGNGNGTFQAQQNFMTGVWPFWVSAADINGDGKLDLEVANRGGNTLSVLLGNGNGTFQNQTIFPSGAQPASMAVADVNGDGRLDVIMSNLGSNSASVFLNADNGNFTGQVYTIDTVSPFVQSINRNNPVGPTTNASSVSFTVTFSEPVTGVDASDFQLALSGTTGTVSQVIPVSGAVYTVTVTGITGNGSLGLNLVDDGSIRDLGGDGLNNPNLPLGFQTQATFATGIFPDSVAVGDVNGDGKPDLIIADRYGNGRAVSVLLGNGNGTFQLQQTYQAGFVPTSVALGDVNGDRKPDLVVTSDSSNFVSILLGNGNGTFQAQQTFSSGPHPWFVAVADVSGDGKPDLIVANRLNATLSVLLGDGDGTFQALHTLASGSPTLPSGSGPLWIEVGDMNGDGKPDLVAANGLDQNTVSVLLGNGNGTFQAQHTFSTGSIPYSLALGDVNGDGKLDIGVANAGSGNVSLLLGNGNGTFQAQQTLSTGSSPRAIAFGDVSGDGFLDIVAANYGTTTVSMLLGNGNGTFQAQQTFATGSQPLSLAFGDMNNDGRADLAIANFNNNTVSILLNAGNGNFTGQTYNIVNATHFSVSAPSSVTAGNATLFTVTALDSFNNTATTYTGTVGFTTSDSQALLSSSTATLTNGVGTFAVTFKTAGNQTITASDTTTASITGTNNSIVVLAAPANHLGVMSLTSSFTGAASGPTNFATTGEPLCFTVMAQDPFNNVNTGYSGTVHFSSSDTASGVVLPANGTLMSGMGVFSATLVTPGTQVLMASDPTDGLTGTSNPIVTRGLVVTSFSPTPSGFTLSFDKPVNASTVNLYTAGSLPDDVILATTGSQISVHGSVLFDPTDTSLTFVKTATATSLGSFNPGSGLLAAGIYTVTLRSFGPQGSGFQDALGAPLDGQDNGTTANFQTTFAVAPPVVAVGIPDFARGYSNTDALFFSPAVADGSTFALSYTNPTANPTIGTATITFSSNAATLARNIQTALSSGGLATQIGTNASANNTPNSVVLVTNDTSTGANVVVTFQSALAQATSQLLASTTPGVSISPATINVSNNIPGMGVPIALSSGLGVISGLFTLQYNPALLTISGAVSRIAGASFTLVSNDSVAGTAVLSFSSPSRISSTATAITLGSLLATVPMSATASYGAKQLLHFSSEQLAGTAGPIAVTNQDGVEVAAYFGDVTDRGGPLTLQDAAAIAAVAKAVPNTAAQTIPGFAAFANLDPVIIGDVALQGAVNSTDGGAMTQELGGISRPTIPYAPIGLQVNPAGSGAAVTGNATAPLKVTNVPKVNVSVEQHTAIVPDSATGQPGGNLVVPPAQANDQTLASVHEQALLLAISASTQPDWYSDSFVADGEQPTDLEDLMQLKSNLAKTAY